MRTKEILSVIIVALTISILSGIMLFGVFEIAPKVSWNMIATAMMMMVLIVVSATLAFYFVFRRYVTERTIKVAMMTLKDDEQVVLRKIMEMGGDVRQDDLWRQLRESFSKSKLSQLVINLENKHAITRTRYHRTNISRLTPEFRKH